MKSPPSALCKTGLQISAKKNEFAALPSFLTNGSTKRVSQNCNKKKSNKLQMYFAWQKYSLKMQISKVENVCYKFCHLLQYCT